MTDPASSFAYSCAQSAVSRILSLMVRNQQNESHTDGGTNALTSYSARAARDGKRHKQAFARERCH